MNSTDKTALAVGCVFCIALAVAGPRDPAPAAYVDQGPLSSIEVPRQYEVEMRGAVESTPTTLPLTWAPRMMQQHVIRIEMVEQRVINLEHRIESLDTYLRAPETIRAIQKKVQKREEGFLVRDDFP